MKYNSKWERSLCSLSNLHWYWFFSENIISIPLNSAMNTEGDYLAAFHHLVMPIALEYNPELVFVALGFDSAYYDDLLENGQAIKAHGFVLKTPEKKNTA